MRDKYTKGHSERVTHLALQIAEKFGLDEQDKYVLKYGGYLHDVGKIGIPDRILLKPGPLTEEEWVIMKQHPLKGFSMLSDLDFSSQLKPIILYHHERYDGKGYPVGLKGEEIPFVARIAGVADAFDAMTSDRPYRKAMDIKTAMEEIKTQAGKQFCPKVASVFLECLEKNFL